MILDFSNPTTFASVETLTLFPSRIARMVLRSSPVSWDVFPNPRALVLALRLPVFLLLLRFSLLFS
jgi:hypothetical protein